MATLDLDSFIAEMKVSGSYEMELTATYVAPDRLHRVSPGGRGEAIVIGRSSYVSDPDRPGYFVEAPPGEPITVADFFQHLAEVASAQDVSTSGTSFSFTLPSGRGEAEVVDGRIVSLTVWEVEEGEEFTTTYAFSTFNEAPPVKPPAEDRIIAHETLPPCDEATPIIEVEGDPVAFICDPAA